MKKMWVLENKDLNGLFTADELISLGFKYQKNIAVPYKVGKSKITGTYSNLDVHIKKLGYLDGDEVFIKLE